jgi:hypothetical protein
MRIVAVQTYSAQVTEDSYRIMQNTLICEESTTVAEVIAWAKSRNSGYVGISLELTVPDSAPTAAASGEKGEGA